MANIFSFGGPQYDVDDVKIAVNNGDGTFGTLIDVPSVDLFQTGIRMKSAEMRGDARITALASQAEAIEFQMRMGSFPPEVYAILFGVAAQSSGVVGNRAKEFAVGAGVRMPYFSIVGRSLAGETAGGTMIWVPYIKIMQTVSVRVEYNAFSMPEVTAMAVGDPVLTDASGRPLLVKFKEYETLPSIAMPLPSVAAS